MDRSRQNPSFQNNAYASCFKTSSSFVALSRDEGEDTLLLSCNVITASSA